MNSGEYDSAEQYFQRGLDLRAAAFGTESRGLADSLNMLAQVSEKKGDAKRAASLYQRALAISQRLLGTEHPDTRDLAARLEAIHPF
jgi:hypothetical protein